jgi:hopanoid biosynthesis associated protein HpnK
MTASRRLIVNADDFGRSSSVNAAVVRAHREGILTSASLMVNEAACKEAVALAREQPQLGVGLHLTLVAGRAALSPPAIPDLVKAGAPEASFRDNPVGVGLRYFFDRKVREQLRAEIRAQFERFRATGLMLDHVNGHLHLHLHPVVFRILMDEALTLGIRHLRLTRDSFRLNARLERGRWCRRITHAIVFGWLSRRARRALATAGIRHTQRVFGLLQDGRVDEAFLLKLLPKLPPGDAELYAHPSLDHSRHELAGLTSPRVTEAVRQCGIELIRYRDL